MKLDFQTLSPDRQAEYHACLNRIKDLDEEGLRKAKMSYRPIDFIKKHRVRLP